jgi:hypothetical protein
MAREDGDDGTTSGVFGRVGHGQAPRRSSSAAYAHVPSAGFMLNDVDFR